MAKIFSVFLLSILFLKFITGVCELDRDFHNLVANVRIGTAETYDITCDKHFYSRIGVRITCGLNTWENIDPTIPLCQRMKCPVRNEGRMEMFCVFGTCHFEVNEQYQITENWIPNDEVIVCYANGILTIGLEAKVCRVDVAANERIITNTLCSRVADTIDVKPICRTNRVPGYVYGTPPNQSETFDFICVGDVIVHRFVADTQYCTIPISRAHVVRVDLTRCANLKPNDGSQHSVSCIVTAAAGYEILDINTSDDVIVEISNTCVDSKLPVQKYPVRRKVCVTNVIEFTARNKGHKKSYIRLVSGNLCFFDRNTNTVHYELACTLSVTGSNSLLNNNIKVNSIALNCANGNYILPIKISPHHCSQNLPPNSADRFYTQSEGCFVDKVANTLSVEVSCSIRAYKGYTIIEDVDNLSDTLLITCTVNNAMDKTITNIRPYQCPIVINTLITDDQPGQNYHTDYLLVDGDVGRVQTEYFVTANRGFRLVVGATNKKTQRLFCSSEATLDPAAITVERISCPAVATSQIGLDQKSTANRCVLDGGNINKECIIRANRGIHFDARTQGRLVDLADINIINSYCVYPNTQFITRQIDFAKNECEVPDVTLNTVDVKRDCKPGSDANEIHGECIYYTQRGNYITWGDQKVSSQIVYCARPDVINIDELIANRYHCDAPARENDRPVTKFRGNCATNGRLTDLAGFLDECYIFTETGYHFLVDDSVEMAHETIVFCKNEGDTNIGRVVLHPNSCSIAVTNGENLHLFGGTNLCRFNEAKSVASFEADCAVKTSEGYNMAPFGEVYLASCPNNGGQLSIDVAANTCSFPRIVPFSKWGASEKQNYTALCARRADGAVIRGCTLKAEPRFYFGDIRHPTNATQTLSFFCTLQNEPSVAEAFIFPHLCRFPDFFVDNIQVAHSKYAKAQNCEVFGLGQKFFGQCVLQANEDFIFIDEKSVQTNVIRLDCFRHSEIDRKIRIKRNICLAPPLEHGSLDEDCYKLRVGEMCRYQCFNQFAVDSGKGRKIQCLHDENTGKLSFYPKPVCMLVEKEWLMDVLWFVFGLSLFVFLVCSFCLFLFVRRFHNFDAPKN